MIELVKAGDPSGWDRFILLYRRLIEYWARTKGTSEQDLDDVCQEVFRVMAIRLEEFRLRDRTGSFRKWLRTITGYVCQEQHRKKRKIAGAQGGTEALLHLQNMADPLLDEPDADEDPADLVTDLIRRAVELVRSETTTRDWSVVEMLVFEDRSPQEVAEHLGLSTANVRKIKSRFLRRLRVELGSP